MSGPKVVRVVTREEIIARCDAALFRVESVLADAKALASRVDDTGNESLAKIEQRIQALRAEVSAGRIEGLQAKITSIEPLVADLRGKILDDAQVRLEKRRDKDRLLIASARTVAEALSAGRPQLSQKLSAAMAKEGRYSRADLDALEVMLKEGYAALAKQPAHPVKVDGDLLSRFSENVEDRSFAEWLSQQTNLSSEDSRLRRLMGQLEALSGEKVEVFRSRAFAIERQVDQARKALLTDSLVLELGAAVQAERRRSEVVVRASAIRRRLSALNDASAANALAQLDHALSRPEIEVLEAAMNAADTALEKAEAMQVADARRRAVLTGLAKLGYSIEEGMATAWSQRGRIVVGRPNLADYGVELGATPDGQTLQVRLVGADSPVSPRSKERDTKAEATWCSEFTELQKIVSDNGGELQIRRAIGVGVEPVRSVSTSDIERARILDASRGGLRSKEK